MLSATGICRAFAYWGKMVWPDGLRFRSFGMLAFAYDARLARSASRRRVVALPCAVAVFAALLVSCGRPIPMGAENDIRGGSRGDLHSHANPGEIRVRHVVLDLDVSFEDKTLTGSALLTIDRVAADANRLVVDTRDLEIRRVEVRGSRGDFSQTAFELGGSDPILGAPLSISVPADAAAVRVHYATSPAASGLQWLDPPQTAGKQHPFLFTQSQAIHARSWIPLQDSPGVRVTYSATIRTPPELRAVMSAELRGARDGTPRGEHRFVMEQAIPPYLIALAAGDLVFEPMSGRTGVWAEPAVVKRAAREFEDTESMMQAVESLYGSYRWGRHDLLVLPPSFPFGGMENPRLTFATPTILAGDKSLVSLVAHELAHSWSGNLVSNATWRDFWLNEGFTVYVENRIQEAVFGRERALMEASLEVHELEEELARLKPADQVLHADLSGRDPDEGFTTVPYIKGMLFLLSLETAAGRPAFDAFLRSYFDHFAFQSITTEDFLNYLEETLLKENPSIGERVPIARWISEPGLPDAFPRPASDALSKVREQARSWLAGEAALRDIETREWVTQQWLHFLRALPERLDDARLLELDEAFEFSRSGNSEILYQWLLIAVRNDFADANQELELFLTTVGRRKFLKPLYQELVKTPDGLARARRIYGKAKAGYHPIASATIEDILRGAEQ